MWADPCADRRKRSNHDERDGGDGFVAAAAELEPKPGGACVVALTMSVDVITEIDIDRAVADVAAYAADPSNSPAWYANIESVVWKTEPPLRVGSVVAFAARFLGRRLEYSYEIVELVAGERLVMRTAEGPFPMETTYTWAPTPGGGTHMALRNRGRPTGFSVVVTPLMVPAMRRANRKDLAALKSILERPRT